MRFGTPDIGKTLAAAAIVLIGGCQTTHQAAQYSQRQWYKVAEVPPQRAPDLVNPVPIESDPAMASRNWPVTYASYPNFSTTAGSAQTMYEVRPAKNSYFEAFLETPMFVIDSVLIPVAMFQYSPTAEVEATSFYVPPSYTANPPSEPRGREDLSGGTGVGYTTAVGRTPEFPAK